MSNHLLMKFQRQHFLPSYFKILSVDASFTLLLKIGSNCLDLKGHFVSDVKIERETN